MRLVIDLQAAQGPSRYRGIGRYAMALTQSMLQHRGAHEVYIALNGLFPDSVVELRECFSGTIPDENFIVWNAVGPVNASDPQNDGRREAAELIRESAIASVDPDFILVCSVFEGFGENIVTSTGRLVSVPTAAILHDLIPLIHRDVYLQSKDVSKWYENKLGHLRNCDLLLANSESSRQEALDWLSYPDDEVFCISTGSDEKFCPGAISLDAKAKFEIKYGINRPFVMYTGGIDHRKNIEGLISAFARLPDEIRQAHQLAIVCSIQEPDRVRLLKLASDEGLSADDVALTGFIPDEDLLAFYRSCKMFAFPSWHEGFGLPALEAMRCGRAVIASDRSALPEVVGRADALFDPFDTDAISAKMLNVLTDDRFRAELEEHGLVQARKFDWNITAKRAWAALEASHAKRRSEAGTPRPVTAGLPRRPRLAYVSPLMPDTSGISDYSAELLPELARHYRIDVITAQGITSDPWVLGNCAVRDPNWFCAHVQEFDRVLYHFGNSHFHSHMFELLRHVPGVVVLHDFFLSGAVSYLEGSGQSPGEWTRELSRSHGWATVVERFRAQDPDALLWTHPCNLSVLQDAMGVIVHAEYSKSLADHWYGEGVANDWELVAQLRQPINFEERSRSRGALGVPQSDFVVCSFGILGKSKLNDRLLDAWLASPLAQDSRCRLVFVGQNSSDDYGSDLVRRIRDSAFGRIEITGWTDQASFRHWLNAADVAVQLRTLSRGETSRTVLDCMSNAVATIVNANGSMGELPQDCVVMLDDDFDTDDLTRALTQLWQDAGRRQALAARAQAYTRLHHNPRNCAARYAEAIERFYAKAARGEHGLLRALVENEACHDLDWSALSKAISCSLPRKPRRKQLLVDVSVLVQVDARSGIQRVVRAVLSKWLETPPEGWSVEPVYADVSGGCYRHARKFTCGFLGIPDDWCSDDVMEPCAGDVFVGLDYHPEIPTQQQAILREWQAQGVGIHFVLYDMLSLQLPDYFPSGTREAQIHWLKTVSQFDGVACISRAVADEFRDWLEKNEPHHAKRLAISWFHLGADTDNSVPTTGRPADADRTLALLGKAPSFLAVGTIEPRKGHRQTLAAFDQVWAQGGNANLVFVGKLGWLMDDFAKEVRRHSEFGKRLFWLESISDEYLDEIYAACTVLLAPSEGEGFGLPIVEASRHGLPVLARDLPVFREVAGPDAMFFADQLAPAVIVESVKRILQHKPLRQSGKGIWQTWEQSAQDLMACILAKRSSGLQTPPSQDEIRPAAAKVLAVPASF